MYFTLFNKANVLLRRSPTSSSSISRLSRIPRVLSASLIESNESDGFLTISTLASSIALLISWISDVFLKSFANSIRAMIPLISPSPFFLRRSSTNEYVLISPWIAPVNSLVLASFSAFFRFLNISFNTFFASGLLFSSRTLVSICTFDSALQNRLCAFLCSLSILLCSALDASANTSLKHFSALLNASDATWYSFDASSRFPALIWASAMSV